VKVLRKVAIAVVALLLIAAALMAWLYFVRPGMSAYTAHHYVAAPAKPGELTASWFGVTAVLLSDGEHAIFIDPFFTRPAGLLKLLRNTEISPDEALIAAWLKRAGVTKLDAVLVSHSHYDHAMDAGTVARLTGAKLVGSASTANIGRSAGLPESQIAILKSGDESAYGPFHVTFVESKHAGATGGKPTGDIVAPLQPPLHYLDYKQGGTYSILIEHAQGTVLHHGSAGFVPGVLKLRHADVVFLGIALLPDLDAYLAEVVDAVGAHRVIPVHWDDFTRPLDQPLQPFPGIVKLDAFFSKLQAQRPDLVVQTLNLAEPAALFAAAAPAP
jgi:L-ascorbate metabolism protein UlaG (beta-lactamase superfamily)